MQKKLLTMAVAGALAVPGIALAQSSVEVYGTINTSFGNVKFTAPTSGVGGDISKWDVASHASNYGLRGRESLGAGLTAWFQIEQNAPMERSNNVATTPASRNTAVGMQGGWGNVFMGQWTTPWADLDALWSIGTVGGWGPVTSIIGRRETTGSTPAPNCINGHLSPLAGVCDAVEAAGGVGHPFWRRASQSVFYQSPVFGGAQAKFAYQTNDMKATTGTPENPSLWSASLQWAGMGGRLRIGGAYDSHKDFTTVGQKDSGFAIKGGWNFGFADVGLAYEDVTYKTLIGDCESKNYGVALAIPVGSGAIRASFSQADDLDQAGCGPVGTPISPAGSTVGDNGAKQWNIGYDHRFSKRTTVGVGYATIDNDAAGAHNWTGLPTRQDGATNAPAAGSDVKTFFVNMIHRF